MVMVSLLITVMVTVTLKTCKCKISLILNTDTDWGAQEAIGEGHVPDQSVLDISPMGTISPANDDQCCHRDRGRFGRATYRYQTSKRQDRGFNQQMQQ